VSSYKEFYEYVSKLNEIPNGLRSFHKPNAKLGESSDWLLEPGVPFSDIEGLGSMKLFFGSEYSYDLNRDLVTFVTKPTNINETYDLGVSGTHNAIISSTVACLDGTPSVILAFSLDCEGICIYLSGRMVRVTEDYIRCYDCPELGGVALLPDTIKEQLVEYWIYGEFPDSDDNSIDFNSFLVGVGVPDLSSYQLTESDVYKVMLFNTYDVNFTSPIEGHDVSSVYITPFDIKYRGNIYEIDEVYKYEGKLYVYFENKCIVVGGGKVLIYVSSSDN
jgi:hypothetical protein